MICDFDTVYVELLFHLSWFNLRCWLTRIRCLLLKLIEMAVISKRSRMICADGVIYKMRWSAGLHEVLLLLSVSIWGTSLALPKVLGMNRSIVLDLLSLRSSREKLGKLGWCLMKLAVLRVLERLLLLSILNLIGKILPIGIIKSVGMLALLD